jgi:2-polyprenyl-3-methyl-5-hydroxy-6-metoxy-1,4-benzoquinol methylase
MPHIQENKSGQDLLADEANWWNLWNTSHRSEDGRDPTSTELFALVAAIVRSLDTGSGKRILEVGCGTGTLSRQLEFSSYHGLDVSPAAVEVARKKAALIAISSGSNPPTYEVADVHICALPRGAFDIVVCVDAVAYFHDQRLALKKMAESLAPRGRLVLTTINPFVYNRIRRTAQSPLKEGSISHWLSRRALHELVSSAGLVTECSYTVMPRGNKGILRLINSPRLNGLFGPKSTAFLRSVKEQLGLGQYRVIVARNRLSQ